MQRNVGALTAVLRQLLCFRDEIEKVYPFLSDFQLCSCVVIQRITAEPGPCICPLSSRRNDPGWRRRIARWVSSVHLQAEITQILSSRNSSKWIETTCSPHFTKRKHMSTQCSCQSNEWCCSDTLGGPRISCFSISSSLKQAPPKRKETAPRATHKIFEMTGIAIWNLKRIGKVTKFLHNSMLHTDPWLGWISHQASENETCMLLCDQINLKAPRWPQLLGFVAKLHYQLGMMRNGLREWQASNEAEA